MLLGHKCPDMSHQPHMCSLHACYMLVTCLLHARVAGGGDLCFGPTSCSPRRRCFTPRQSTAFSAKPFYKWASLAIGTLSQPLLAKLSNHSRRPPSTKTTPTIALQGFSALLIEMASAACSVLASAPRHEVRPIRLRGGCWACQWPCQCPMPSNRAKYC